MEYSDIIIGPADLPRRRGWNSSKRSAAERFMAAVSHFSPDECWIWPGAISSGGYGMMKVRGKMRYVTHVSLILAGRPRPPAPRHNALHGDLCVARSCVNPAHLRWGTVKENAADASRLGRLSTPRIMGERSRSAKLTEADVSLIRASSLSNADLARNFSVAPHTVSVARRGLTWKHM